MNTRVTIFIRILLVLSIAVGIGLLPTHAAAQSSKKKKPRPAKTPFQVIFEQNLARMKAQQEKLRQAQIANQKKQKALQAQRRKQAQLRQAEFLRRQAEAQQRWQEQMEQARENFRRMFGSSQTRNSAPTNSHNTQTSKQSQVPIAKKTRLPQPAPRREKADGAKSHSVAIPDRNPRKESAERARAEQNAREQRRLEALNAAANEEARLRAQQRHAEYQRQIASAKAAKLQAEHEARELRRFEALNREAKAQADLNKARLAKQRAVERSPDDIHLESAQILNNNRHAEYQRQIASAKASKLQAEHEARELRRFEALNREAKAQADLNKARLAEQRTVQRSPDDIHLESAQILNNNRPTSAHVNAQQKAIIDPVFNQAAPPDNNSLIGSNGEINAEPKKGFLSGISDYMGAKYDALKQSAAGLTKAGIDKAADIGKDMKLYSELGTDYLKRWWNGDSGETDGLGDETASDADIAKILNDGGNSDISEQSTGSAEEKTKAQAAEQARLAAEEKAKAQAAEQARLAAEEKAKAQAAEQARLAAEEKARAEAAQQARLAAEEKAKAEAAEQARLAAEEKAKAEAAEQARLAAEEKAKAEAERNDFLAKHRCGQEQGAVDTVDDTNKLLKYVGHAGIDKLVSNSSIVLKYSSGSKYSASGARLVNGMILQKSKGKLILATVKEDKKPNFDAVQFCWLGGNSIQMTGIRPVTQGTAYAVYTLTPEKNDPTRKSFSIVYNTEKSRFNLKEKYQHLQVQANNKFSWEMRDTDFRGQIFTVK